MIYPRYGKEYSKIVFKIPSKDLNASFPINLLAGPLWSQCSDAPPYINSPARECRTELFSRPCFSSCCRTVGLWNMFRTKPQRNPKEACKKICKFVVKFCVKFALQSVERNYITIIMEEETRPCPLLRYSIIKFHCRMKSSSSSLFLSVQFFKMGIVQRKQSSIFQRRIFDLILKCNFLPIPGDEIHWSKQSFGANCVGLEKMSISMRWHRLDIGSWTNMKQMFSGKIIRLYLLTMWTSEVSNVPEKIWKKENYDYWLWNKMLMIIEDEASANKVVIWNMCLLT